MILTKESDTHISITAEKPGAKEIKLTASGSDLFDAMNNAREELLARTQDDLYVITDFKEGRFPGAEKVQTNFRSYDFGRGIG